AGPSQQLGIAAPRGKPIRVLGQLERVRIAPVGAKDRENQERVRAECIVVEPFSQPQRAASMALAPSAFRGRADVSGLGEHGVNGRLELWNASGFRKGIAEQSDSRVRG